MKKLIPFKKLLVLTASALMLAVLPNTSALTAAAAEPETYYIMYDGAAANGGDWFYQTGSTWDDTADHREIYYMLETLKDGDAVIVGAGADSQLTLNVRLSNLTLKNAGQPFAKISVTGGIDNCFFLSGAQGSIDGNVVNAYVYDNSVANFNHNVTNLYSYDNDPDAGPTIGVAGTVAYYEAQDSDSDSAPRGTNFAANSFHVENGKLTTPGEKFTSGGTGPAASNETTATPQPSPTPAASSAADEYDKVPKTGESSPLVWLSLLAAACLSTGLILRKSANYQ